MKGCWSKIDRLDLYNRYRDIMGMEKLDFSQVKFDFKRTKIANKSELIKVANDSKGLVPESYRLLQYPGIDDAEEAKKEMAADAQGIKLE